MKLEGVLASKRINEVDPDLPSEMINNAVFLAGATVEELQHLIRIKASKILLM